MKTVAALYLLVLAVMAGLGVFTPTVDADLNPVTGSAVAVDADTQVFHDTLFVADLHSDMLLWDRDHRAQQTRGQTDLPRLRAGGVDLQVFSTVTASPKGQNFGSNTLDSGDQITTLAAAQVWPLSTLGSVRARAVHQAERLHALERQGHLTIVRTASDLDAPGLKGLLLTEGAHPLEGDLDNVAYLHAAGYRVMGLQHFFDNALGGSLHGQSREGLTPFGRDAVAEMESLGIIVDLAHSSEAVVDDVLEMASRPVIVSHTGLRAACPGTETRNMSDARLQRIAAAGGLIGVGYFEGAICDTSVAGIARTIAIAVDLLGADAVALGSDFDGTVATSLDTSQLAQITQALRDIGMDNSTISKVMGQNALSFFRDNLPDAAND